MLGSQWVYTIKENSDGSLEWHKTWVVAKGFTQKYGLDYQETFALVAKMNTIRLLLALAAHRGWTLQQYDVKNAFLHGDLTEEIYMALPPGYSSLVPSTPASVVCRLWPQAVSSSMVCSLYFYHADAGLSAVQRGSYPVLSSFHVRGSGDLLGLRG